MTSKAKSPEQYIKEAPKERQQALQQLRKTIVDNLPKGFKEEMSYGMIGYVVPHTIYSEGYHCNPKLPLPFISFASQKNSINFYHMGMYANKETLDWFVAQYPKYCKRKLDMGKSCIRFKKIDEIPYQLLAKLVQKITVKQWVEIYEKAIKK